MITRRLAYLRLLLFAEMKLVRYVVRWASQANGDLADVALRKIIPL